MARAPPAATTTQGIDMSPTNRRSFIARTAALAAAPTAAMLAGAVPAHVASASTTTPPLPDYAPIPPGALGSSVNKYGCIRTVRLGVGQSRWGQCSPVGD
jgi:hypothetical protein